ncbi:MAG: hypothetical protein JSS66_13830 [Armatimonadetes bacterium]|nr:hypothetical protein [Armatimonadota bacterium]
MKKWLIAFTASAVLIGCGGGSGLDGLNGGGSGGGSGGGGGTRTIPTPNLGPNAQMQVLYLSGQGRRSPGSQIAILDNIIIKNSSTDFYPKDHQGSGAGVRIQLDGYTLNQYVFDVPMTIGAASKTYGLFPLEIARMDEEDQSGQFNPIFTGPPQLVGSFDTNIQLYPGRQTTIQVVLNDQMLRFDSQLGVVFDSNQFKLENYNPADNKIEGFISDMVSFDCSALAPADRPLMTDGSRAVMAHFSGDSIGISGQFNNSAKPKALFDILSPIVIDSGVLTKEEIVGGRKAPGIYTVNEPDPRDPFGNAKLVAIQGIYRPYTEVLNNLSDFGMIAMPTSRNTDTYQVVLFNRDANGTITALWQGTMKATGATKGVLRLFSLDQLPDAGASPRATGEVSFTKVGGLIRQGTFSVAQSPANFPFPKTGGFGVFR